MKEEINRLLAYLKETDPRTQDYATLINNIYNLLHIKKTIEMLNAEPAKWDNAKTIEVPKFEGFKEEPKEEPTTEEVEPVVTDEVIIEKPTKITYEEVRSIFKDAASNGVIIRPIISKYIPEGAANNLSSVPADKYEQLLEDLKNAR